jgi:hypothetical protein
MRSPLGYPPLIGPRRSAGGSNELKLEPGRRSGTMPGLRRCIHRQGFPAGPRGLRRRAAMPGGAELKTLKKAIAYLAKTVPKAEQNMPEVLAAAEALTNAPEREIAWMFTARIATVVSGL